MNSAPRKRFGQNFLVDPGVVDRILSAVDPQPGESLVEIGPGRGALTRPLLEAGVDLRVVEIDRDLAAAMDRIAPGLAPEHIHVGDALDTDFPRLWDPPGEDIRVVGNLPYNISTPLLFHLLGFGDAIHDMHFMLQKEVVERAAADPGGRDYGRLSVMCQYHCRVVSLFTVPPGAFKPAPKVESAFVRLTPHAAPPVSIGDYDVFRRVVAQAFSQRRKTLRNSLGKLMSSEMIEAAGVDPSLRAEALTLEQYAALSSVLMRSSWQTREGENQDHHGS